MALARPWKSGDKRHTPLQSDFASQNSDGMETEKKMKGELAFESKRGSTALAQVATLASLFTSFSCTARPYKDMHVVYIMHSSISDLSSRPHGHSHIAGCTVCTCAMPLSMQGIGWKVQLATVLSVRPCENSAGTDGGKLKMKDNCGK